MGRTPLESRQPTVSKTSGIWHERRSIESSTPPPPPLCKGGKLRGGPASSHPLTKEGQGGGFRSGPQAWAIQLFGALALVLAAAAVGLGLIWESIQASSATYDEAAYLRIAARWWRTGQQFQITRMGSPLLFWKLQQAPVLWLLDRTGRGELIDQPMEHQAELLPLVRAGSLWIWLLALGLCAFWSRLLYGPRAMALAAWLFALSPNLLAHGGLVTMELPLLASTTGMLLLFWSFLTTGRRAWFWASAALGGVAFSCKFTAVLLPPILAVVWW